MKNFVKGLLTNRFGIVLAALNVCYFLSVNFPKANYPSNNFGITMLILNFPAAILTYVPLGIIKFLFSVSEILLYRQLVSVIYLFFVTFQWLFISWLANKIAQKFMK